MWRFVALALLGVFIGTRARSERAVVVLSLLTGVMYGAAAAVSTAAIVGPPSPGRVLFYLLMGLVLAAPVYAVAEIWRRTRTRSAGWLRRLLRS